MTRRRTELQQLDVSSWPTVAYTELSQTVQAQFLKRKQAIEMFVANDAVRAIEAATGVDRRQLYNMLSRCLAQHGDGRLYGFRALLHYQRIAGYQRRAELGVQGRRGGRGAGGALSWLLERYPALVEWIKQQIRLRQVVLEQIGTEGRLKTRLRGLANVHKVFLQQCRALGLTAADYPLNTDDLARRSLAKRIKAELLASFGRAAHAAGAKHLKGLPRVAEGDVAPAASRPYEIVEFDGHRLDLRLKIVVRDPLGFLQEFEIERVWLLVIIDVFTRAVLGYHMVLDREYSRYDVIKTIENTLAPHQRRSFKLPGLGYGALADFPSSKLPELGYATWQWMRLDNAKANLADDTLAALCEFVGCFVDAGPAHTPDERPYIERFFGTMASTLSARLPGYTGSSPMDLRRALSDPKGDVRLFVSLDELEELLETALAHYNATPHAGLNGRTPLEALEYCVRGKGALLQWLPEYKRRTLCLLQRARRCKVRGYLGAGTRPHINLFKVRYTSEVLANATPALGTELLVYLNTDDLRTVRAFLPDGTELGELRAQGAWGVIAHNLKLRQVIMQLRDRKRLTATISQEFIENYLQDKRAKAKTSRRAASELAKTMDTLARAPTLATSSSRQMTTTTYAVENKINVPIATPEPPPPNTNRPPQKIRPEVLDIGTGQVF